MRKRARGSQILRQSLMILSVARAKMSESDYEHFEVPIDSRDTLPLVTKVDIFNPSRLLNIVAYIYPLAS